MGDPSDHRRGPICGQPPARHGVGTRQPEWVVTVVCGRAMRVLPLKQYGWLVCGCGAEPKPLQPRQDGFSEIRQFCEIVDEVER